MGVMEMNELLQSCGLKCTKQRLCILEILNSADKPLTAEEIHTLTPGTALSTVYRILDKLLEKNIVIKTTIPLSDGIFYELTANEHKHFAICLACHKLKYIDICPIHNTTVSDFTITGHKLELYGYCRECVK